MRRFAHTQHNLIMSESTTICETKMCTCKRGCQPQCWLHPSYGDSSVGYAHAPTLVRNWCAAADRAPRRRWQRQGSWTVQQCRLQFGNMKRGACPRRPTDGALGWLQRVHIPFKRTNRLYVTDCNGGVRPCTGTTRGFVETSPHQHLAKIMKHTRWSN